MQTFLEALKAICFVLDDESKNDYGLDWTRFYTPSLLAVAFPRSTEEVSAILRLCSQHDVKIVPSGGRTGLSGGACATQNELVLSLTRMNKILESDFLGNTLRVQAGTDAFSNLAAPSKKTTPDSISNNSSSEAKAP